tara:strand:+ start:10607 stop:10882 length:276 start_codon:yes stop_codon:yes gene_type:complete
MKLLTKFTEPSVNTMFASLLTIVTAGGLYALYLRLENLGWATLQQEWITYLLIYAVMASVIVMFWTFASIIETCERQAAKFYEELADITQH